MSDLCSPCDDYAALGAVAEDFLQLASDAMYVLTGRKYPGECTATVRPCARRVAYDRRPLGVDAVPRHGFAGTWPGAFSSPLGWGLCGCAGACGCSRLNEVELGAYPIVEVSRVTVDGVDLRGPDDESPQYRVDEWRKLVRLPDADGTNPGWPFCQDLELPGDAVGAWEVEFRWGRMPPRHCVLAAATLACELARACEPEDGGECRLPRRVQSIVRSGVQMTFTDLASLIANDRTGIAEVDLAIKAENPHGHRHQSSVWTPGMGRAVRRAGT